MNARTATVRLYVTTVSLLTAVLSLACNVVRLLVAVVSLAVNRVERAKGEAPRPAPAPAPVAVVSSPVPGTRERVESGLVGLGFKPRDVRRYVEGLGLRADAEPVEALIKDGLRALAS